MWFLDDVHAAAVSGLRGAAAAVETEQATRGIDALDEIPLQALVAEGLRAGRFGVHREVRYPAERARRRRSEGRRCDLVLTPDGLPLEDDGAQASLFGPARACALGDALWTELKVVAQFIEERANRGYGAALQGPIWRDLAKLARDPRIEHAAQLVILFTVDETAARHDLSVTLDRAWSRGLRVDAAHVAHFPIGDRFGNGCCTVALARVLR